MEEDLPLLKVALVGESGVGKTNLLLRFTKDKFDSNSKSTIGVEFCSKATPYAKLQIWDTAGQERFSTLSSAYYRNSGVAIFVFDITRRTTLEAIPKHLQSFREVVGKDTAELLLIGNKADFADRREVTTEEAENFASNNGMMYLECSAKDFDKVVFESKIEEVCTKYLVTTQKD